MTVPNNRIATDALLDRVLELAFEEEAAERQQQEQEACEDAEKTAVPPALDRRIRGRIRLWSAAELLKRHARGITAAFVCVLAVSIALAVSMRASADAPVWTMTSEPDAYGQTLLVSFVTESDAPRDPGEIDPLSLASVLAEPVPERTASYRTDAAYLEEYAGGIRYEQCLLSESGVTVIPSKGRTVKNIVIGGRPAILAFDAQSAAILWQDGVCSYLLTGPFSADEAMRTARSLTGE